LEHGHGHSQDQKSHLKEVHDDVPPDYYDKSIKTNLIQRFYHGERFKKICELATRADGPLLDVGCDGGTLLDSLETQKHFRLRVARSLQSSARR
jgi:hypothetical protein